LKEKVTKGALKKVSSEAKVLSLQNSTTEENSQNSKFQAQAAKHGMTRSALMEPGKKLKGIGLLGKLK
jgi:hypothetical protein